MKNRDNPFLQPAFSPDVYVASGESAYQNTCNALEKIDLSVMSGKRVLVKPNAGRIANAGAGITTEPQVVAAAIDRLSDVGAIVDVGESPISGVKSLEALEATGITEVAKKRDIPLIDLDVRRYVSVSIPDGLAINSLKVCADVLEYDFVISVPVMKMHMHTGVSLAIKNMKGCLWRRSKVDLHMLPVIEGIDEKPIDIAIADLSGVLKPHLSIIDGTIGMEGLGPSAGKPKAMGTVVVGADPFAADAVACRLMGIKAEDVPHLAMGAARGYGVIDIDTINVSPNNWMTFGTKFELPPSDLSFDFPDFNIADKNSCSACQSTLLLLLKRYGKNMLEYYPANSTVEIAIGKGHEELPKGTLCLGNCTKMHKETGIYVKGCPPVSSEILRALTGEPIVDSKDGHSDASGIEDLLKDE